VQGFVVAGVTEGNVSDENNTAALALAEFVVGELAKTDIRAGAAVLSQDGLQRIPRGGSGVEIGVVTRPRRGDALP